MMGSIWNFIMTFRLLGLSGAGAREMAGMNAEPSEAEIQSKWPLHWMVWKDDHTALKRLLKEEAQVGSMVAS